MSKGADREYGVVSATCRTSCDELTSDKPSHRYSAPADDVLSTPLALYCIAPRRNDRLWMILVQFIEIHVSRHIHENVRNLTLYIVMLNKSWRRNGGRLYTANPWGFDSHPCLSDVSSQGLNTRKPCCRRESARCRCNFRSIDQDMINKDQWRTDFKLSYVTYTYLIYNLITYMLTNFTYLFTAV